jgi:anti-sigma regulatory factor (Ser/Thr protein kinase)
MHMSHSFAPDAQSVRQVRYFVRHALRAAGAGEEAVDDAVLLASEVAGNVVRHAKTDYEVTVALSSELARIEFHDGSSVIPAVRELGGPDDEGGRGLAVVATLALEWGVHDKPEGKVVWFVLPLTGRGAPPQSAPDQEEPNQEEPNQEKVAGVAT